MKSEAELITMMVKDERCYETLEYLYIHERLYAKNAKDVCNVRMLHRLKDERLINRIFWKRGKYVASAYVINDIGKQLYQMATVLREKLGITFEGR